MRGARKGDVVFFASLRVSRLIDQDGVGVAAYGYDEKNKSELMVAERQAQEIAEKLTQLGIKVILDLPKPVFRSMPFRCSDSFNQMNPVCSAGFSIDRAFMEEHRKPVVEAINRVAAAVPGVFVWDPLPILCPNDPCGAFDGDKPLFFDADHLSGYGNDLLAPSFVEFLAGVNSAIGN